MSLILEALKKSEAERRLGQAPNLMTPMPLRRARRDVGPMVVAALVVGTIAAAAAWWWIRDRDAAMATTASMSPTTTTVDPTAETVAAAAPAASSVPAPPSPQPRRETSATAVTGSIQNPQTAISPSPRSAPAPLSAPVDAPTPDDPRFASVERESVPAPAPMAAPPTPAAEFPASEPVRPNADAKPVPLPDSATTATSTPLIDATPEFPRLDQLAASDRDALPPLKLSLHVYTEDPAGRFVLVDGRRYREGEKLAASLQVIEIRRDGVLFDFNGRQFLLMRP